MPEPDTLLETIRAVKMICADCGEPSDTEKDCTEAPGHTWETDDAGIARAVRAWLARIEPTREEVARTLYLAQSPATFWTRLDAEEKNWWLVPADQLLALFHERRA